MRGAVHDYSFAGSELLLKTQPPRPILVAVAAAIVLVGCGQKGPYERVIVSGSVSYDGQPVEFGMIRFQPTGETRAPASGGYIMNSEYKVDQRGGVPVGTHKVIIQAFTGGIPASSTDRSKGRAPGIEDDPVGPRKTNKQFLPPKYNDKTELTIQIDSQSGELTKDWDLTP